MRKLITYGAFALLAACSSTTGQVDQAQLQKDLATAMIVLQATGCATATLAQASSPIIVVAFDEQGNKVLNMVGTAGAVLCAALAPKAVASLAGTTLGAVAPAPSP